MLIFQKKIAVVAILVISPRVSKKKSSPLCGWPLFLLSAIIYSPLSFSLCVCVCPGAIGRDYLARSQTAVNDWKKKKKKKHPNSYRRQPNGETLPWFLSRYYCLYFSAEMIRVVHSNLIQNLRKKYKKSWTKRKFSLKTLSFFVCVCVFCVYLS